MKWLFKSADEYLKESDWKDMALLKFCLFSMGVLAGVRLAEEKEQKKTVTIVAAVVFVITYIPLMAKYFGIVKKLCSKSENIC